MSDLIRPSASAWTRDPLDAELTGACAAIARVLGVPALAIRAIFLTGGVSLIVLGVAESFLSLEPLALYALAGVGGSLLLVYLVVWWSLPSDQKALQSLLEERSVAAVRGKPHLAIGAQARTTKLGSLRGAIFRWITLSLILGASTALIVLGLLTLLPASTGRWEPLGASFGLIAAGAALCILPLTLVDAARWSGLVSTLPLGVILCILTGAVLMLGGAMFAILAIMGPETALITFAASLIVIFLLSIVGVPWVKRLWSGMREESEQRALALHQAEVASHLHDSVLQTLTVIQRDGNSPDRMRRLARDQEVELRRWLYGSVTGSAAAPISLVPTHNEEPRSLREAVESIALDIERRHDVEIDIVCVGDHAYSPHIVPLINALREATNNAARHARVGIQIFADASSDILEIYVRDRGPGFDLSSIPEGRLGVRESIIGRMARAGGYARIAPAIGGGTEVALTLEKETVQ